MSKTNDNFDEFVKFLKQDYWWIYEKIKEDCGREESERVKYEDAKQLGDLPRLPPYYIERTEKVCIFIVFFLK